MIRIFIPSTQGEGDYLPNGLYCVNQPGNSLMTSSGLIPFPTGETALRYPAMATDGRVACQPQASVRGAWVLDPVTKQWSTDPRIPASPNSQIFDQAGVLFINQLGPGYVGSNGYRYVNPSNVVITGDATYAARNGVAEWIDLSVNQDGSLLVGYAAWALACIVWDGVHHRLIEAGDAKRLRAHRSGDVVSIAITKVDGCALLATTAQELLTLPIFEPTAPPEPIVIGPTTPPQSADGTLIDILPYLHSDPALQPRLGLTTQPTDTQHQIEMANGLWHHVKFGNPPTYETWAWDAAWTYHLEDASGDPPYSFSDPRWWPRHLAIGPAAGFTTGPHEILHRNRGTCRVIAREPINRFMWLLDAYDGWQWGATLGIRPTIRLVYDNTAGIHNAGRLIEVNAFAKDAGWCRWEAHRSDLVYASGQPIFSAATLVSQSNFYNVGGPATAPALTGCVIQAVPTPPMPIPVQGEFMIDPKTVILYKAQKPSSRAGCVNLILPDDTVFSCQDDGSMGVRPSGTDGPWEQGQVGGSLITYNSGGHYFAFGCAPIDKVL
jgi:hypothetical protein